jgi:hypothetical protein
MKVKTLIEYLQIMDDPYIDVSVVVRSKHGLQTVNDFQCGVFGDSIVGRAFCLVADLQHEKKRD